MVQGGGLPGGVARGVEGAGGGVQGVALPTAALLLVGALLSRGGAGHPRGGHGFSGGAPWGGGGREGTLEVLCSQVDQGPEWQSGTEQSSSHCELVCVEPV